MAVFITTPGIVQALRYMRFGSADSSGKKSVSCIKTETRNKGLQYMDRSANEKNGRKFNVSDITCRNVFLC